MTKMICPDESCGRVLETTSSPDFLRCPIHGPVRVRKPKKEEPKK